MSNNLKQLDLAVHNYDASRDSFDFKAAGHTGQTTANGLKELIAVQHATEADDGVNMLMGDGSVRFLSGGANFQFGDGSVRFAVDPAPMADIEVHTVRHEVVNDALF